MIFGRFEATTTTHYIESFFTKPRSISAVLKYIVVQILPLKWFSNNALVQGRSQNTTDARAQRGHT